MDMATRIITLLSSFFIAFAAIGQESVTVFEWPQDGDTVIGEVQFTTVADGETLLDIAERYGLGYADIRDANPQLDPWIPEVGAKVTLPTQYILPDMPWEGIVINLAEYRLYQFIPERNEIHTYPIGIGQTNSPTPQGNMEITARIPNPTWYPPASIRARWEAQGREVRRQIPAGPENPLGPFAINLSAQGYLIHGTNQRFGIGAQASAGCIRMNNWDIEKLVNNTRIGINVQIIDKPINFGMLGDRVILKVNRPLSSYQNTPSHTDLAYHIGQLRQQHEQHSVQIDWEKVERVFNQKRGTAESITL